MVRYVKCPRCELNYIDADKQEYCDICLAELKGGRFDCVELADEEEEDMELCPICGENMMRVGEKMCDECKKKTAYEEESEVDPEKDEGWRDFIDDETEEVDLPDVPDVTMDDFDSACEYFLKAVHYDPQLSRGWYGLAAVHFDAGYKKQALDYIRQGMAADRYDIDCLRLAWEIEESLERYDDALTHLQEVIDHPESNAEDYLDLAYFLYQRGRLKESLDTLKTTRTLFPEAHEVFYHLCALYCALGQQERCLEMFERAVRLAPEMIGVLRDNYPDLMRVDETNKKIYLTQK